MRWPEIFVFFDRTKKYAWFIPIIVLSYWIYDRSDPPVHITEDPKSTLVTAGTEVVYSIGIKRDLTRRCSAVVNRYILDSNGIRTEFPKDQRFNARAIERLQELNPNRSSFRFPLDKTMPSGQATLFTNLSYTCTANPLTSIWPIEVTREWKFYVLPAAL